MASLLSLLLLILSTFLKMASLLSLLLLILSTFLKMASLLSLLLLILSTFLKRVSLLLLLILSTLLERSIGSYIITTLMLSINQVIVYICYISLVIFVTVHDLEEDMNWD